MEKEPRSIENHAVLAMAEIGPQHLAKAAKMTVGVAAILHREYGPYDWFLVASGENLYTVVRLGFFAQCDCKGFAVGRTICKHIIATLPPSCIECLAPIRITGRKCLKCEAKARKSAPYLKPTSARPVQVIGGIPI